MIGTGVGNIGNADPVRQDFDAVGGLAADHRKPNASAERGARNADFILERIAETVADVFPQHIAGENANRHGGFRRRFLERRGDYDFCDLISTLAGPLLREGAAGAADRERQADGGWQFLALDC